MTENNGMLSVTQLNEYLKMKLDNDLILCDIWVRGEISNFSAPRSGHLYFTLKDEASQVKAVMFKFSAIKLKFIPEDGLKVLLHGRVTVYPAGGQYQIVADEIQPDGAGALAMQFEQLKARLSKEGLFDEDRKKPLPYMPRKIGVITSPTGAAVQDIRKILGRRFPLAQMILFPAQVQGSEAPLQLIAGVDFFDVIYPVDVIIIGRGGGSAEDLWAFNDENLARRIASCNVPVISAVGHEVDFTICDFVADKRAPTPSAAAELAVPDQNELSASLEQTGSLLHRLILRNLEQRKSRLQYLSACGQLTYPDRILEPYRLKLEQKSERLDLSISGKMQKKSGDLERICSALEALNPLKVLGRGYAAVRKQNEPVTSVKQLTAGDTLSVRLQDGRVTAIVEGTEHDEERNRI